VGAGRSRSTARRSFPCRRPRRKTLREFNTRRGTGVMGRSRVRCAASEYGSRLEVEGIGGSFVPRGCCCFCPRTHADINDTGRRFVTRTERSRSRCLGQEYRWHASRHGIAIVEWHRPHLGERRRNRAAKRPIGRELLRDRHLRRRGRCLHAHPSAVCRRGPHVVEIHARQLPGAVLVHGRVLVDAGDPGTLAARGAAQLKEPVRIFALLASADT
jgi:hypothetical protein